MSPTHAVPTRIHVPDRPLLTTVLTAIVCTVALGGFSGSAYAGCALDSRLDELAQLAARDFNTHEARVVAVWPLAGGAANTKLRDYVSREMVERLKKIDGFRTLGLPETIAAARRAKVLNAESISEKKADRLGKVSKMDGLITVRFEEAGEGLILRTQWMETYRGKELGRKRMDVCSSDTLKRLLPPPPPPPVVEAPPPPPPKVEAPPPPVVQAPPPPVVQTPPAPKPPPPWNRRPSRAHHHRR